MSHRPSTEGKLRRASFMKKASKCPKCGETENIAEAKAIDRGDGGSQFEMSLAKFRKPEAFISRKAANLQRNSVLGLIRV